MAQPTQAAIDAEAEVLDAITTHLDKAVNRRGKTIAELAEATGFARGRIEEVCKKSKIVLKRRKQNATLWWNDWSELEPEFLPVRRRGRPPNLKAA